MLDQIESLLREQGAKQSSLATVALTRSVGEITLTLAVSPCSWMYEGYPLQVSVEMTGGGTVYCVDRTKRFATASEQDLKDILDRVGVIPCKCCGKPAFDPATCDTNRSGVCESCFRSESEADLKKAVEQEEALRRKEDDKQRKAGCTHRVDAWVHPETGEDYPVILYLKTKPTARAIEAELQKHHSMVTDDYRITSL